MREVLSIAADFASIVAAVSAAGIFFRIRIYLNSNSSKNANQRANGTGNTQNIKQ